MRRAKYLFYIVMMLLLVWKPMSVSADIGPKPSVKIEFLGLEEEEYYVTLLSEKESTGPWSHGNEYHDYMGDEAVFDQFAGYKDVDGYYFLSYMEDCSEDHIFEWNYYPPQKFKILIYLPVQDRFIMNNQICERYAFDSYYTVNIADWKSTVSVNEASNIDSAVLEIKESYDYSMELVSLIVRIILTIMVELLIALLFYKRDQKAITIIVLANVLTQVVLNILLNVINYNSGHYAFVFHYIWMEMVVFIIEAIIYDKLIGRENKTTGKKYHPWAYAFTANVVSIIVGIWIAKMIPGIF